MKRTMLALGAALALLLGGCAQQEVVWETVTDDPALEVASILPEPYEILFALPEDAQETIETGVYAAPDDAYEIVTQVLPATTPDDAIQTLSGFPADDLEVIELRFGDLPEYQFAWTNETDEGTTYSRALLVADEQYYYVLQFITRDNRATRDAQTAVFSSFGLYYDEGV